ncbi:MAG: chromosome segregation protein SMC [Planctomycetota bacterium]|nr:chromosome segregation protein SMC [Planctomycetota bacterium]
MLKALELAGFKSFADRTRFEFPPGITVVVGPNGSGKSNVVDAIKWVLGEQSARSLRGGEMSDVIFKGSDASGRKPANTAEATLVFDNRDHRLQVDAEEVHVTRRVFRSGEGEYLINKLPCRLRDIRDVFRGTGMGTDAYSIIEQGKVDTLLQASPRDRRAIFEEAAGISRFKAKKIEAQRRLERVDQNLLRMSDIVEELDGRLRSLRAQATKARRYQEYVERLQQLRTQVGFADFRSYNGQFVSAEQRLEENSRHISSLEAECRSLESRRLELDTEKELFEDALRTAETRISHHRQQIATGQTRAHSQLHRYRELHEESNRWGRRFLAFQQNVGTASKQLEMARAELLDAERQFADLTQKVTAERSKLDTASQHVADLQIRMESAREEYHANLRATTERESQVAYWTLRCQETLTGRASAEQREAAAESLCQEAGTNAHKAEEIYEAAVQAENQAQRELDQAQQDFEQLDQEYRGLHDSCIERSRLLEGLRERCTLLTELERTQEGLHSGTRELLLRATEADSIYADIRGLVADLVHVDVDVAPLVDLALGERSQYLIVTGTSLIAAVDQGLVDVGRVGLIAIAELAADAHTIQRNLAAQEEFLSRIRIGEHGVVGPATQFAESNVRDSQIIPYLLGNCWFAETLADARWMIEQGCLGRIFTRDGNVCEPGGIVVLGGYRDRYHIVSRRSELRKLAHEIESTQQSAEAAAQELAATLEQRNACQQVVTRCAQFAENARTDLQKSLWERQQAQLQQKNAQSAWEVARQDRLDLQHQCEQAEASRLGAEADLLGMRQVADHLTQSLQELDRQFRDLSLKRDDDARLVSEMSVELARWQQTVAHRHEHVSRWEREQAERADLEADLLEQGGRANSLLASVEIELLNLTAEMADVYGHIDREERFVLLTREQVIDTAQRRKDATQQLSESRRAKQQAEETAHRDQLEVERLRQLREGLIARFREDFDLELADLLPETVGELDGNKQTAEEEISELRRKISNIGAVNMESLHDLQSLESRYEELAGQYHDLKSAKDALERIIQKINTDSKRLFSETLEQIRQNFQLMFRKVFGGGEADIVMDSSDEDALERGIEIVATPPGKQSLRLSLLSGGERALTAVTLLLAIFQYRPSPFCILDEVDGPLDEANTGRFISVLHEFLAETKFVVVTHSKVTMSAASTLYGVTMQESGVSKQVSVRFEDVHDGGDMALDASHRNNSEDAA